MFKRFTLILVALAALTAIAACGRDEEPAPPPVATAAAPAAPAAPAATVAAPAAPTATATEAPTDAPAQQPESPLAPAGAAQPESPLGGTGDAAAAQVESPLPEPNVLTGSAWQVATLDGSAPAAGTPVTLQFNADGSASGSDGCNRYVASYTLDEDAGTIAFVPGPGTMMGCDQPVMDQAAAYIAALSGAAAFTLEGDTLTLSDTSGEPVLVFAPQQSDLVNSNWEAISYNNGEGGVVTVIGEPAITLAFAEDKASGSGGCNTYSATFVSPSIGQLSFEEIAATERACVQPEGIMEQEQRYLAALAMAATYTVQGDFLDIRTAEGAIAAQFLRAAPAE